MDDFGSGPAALDGTQAPPPPRAFPDPLAGLVTGEQPYRREAVAPIVVPPLAPPQPPSAPYVPSVPAARRPARAAQRPAQMPAQSHRQPAGPHVSGPHVSGPHVTGPHVSGRHVVPGQPTAHLPHPGLARREPAQAPAQQERKKGKGGLIGCLVLLAALSGLLVNVVREIIQAVADLLR
ncbi:hypothetical protein F4560_006921 [Saccharothrix ecbatanensis]|uniref:Uncharacterized protein n=1 Tax=Saccharothrix ecbatanensis TaxID=1105145 RepID=A0A7W9HRL4_9PSEU|nr:hypothetical protein [Saccharothrix ecbatanensis]MBB5807153.1 hypothetical protein [Saccharothrix ecbatanensis]